jgi:hypothetical protein
MKKNSKRSLFMLAACVLGLNMSVVANDLIVAENGTGGAHASIGDALTAAADGDRIFVMPRSGGAAYTENLTIDKSIQLLSGKEGEQFTMVGEIVITPANGRAITIVGLKDLKGSIAGSANNAEGSRCVVKILNSSFMNGNVNFDFDNYDVTLASNIIVGQVVIRNGDIIGNEITYTPTNHTKTVVLLNADTYPENDTVNIIANKIKVNYTGYWNSIGIDVRTSSSFFLISNNLISMDFYNYNCNGIVINKTKESGNGKNYISSNTIVKNADAGSSGSNFGIYIYATAAKSFIEVNNNLILGRPNFNMNDGIIMEAVQATVSFNYNFVNYMTSFLTRISNDGTNNAATNTTIDDEGRLAVGSDAINGGNPDSVYYDIDLTRNDVGAYGGSFTLDNYFPITGAARVYFLQAPRRVIVGNPIEIKAEAFDR